MKNTISSRFKLLTTSLNAIASKQNNHWKWFTQNDLHHHISGAVNILKKHNIEFDVVLFPTPTIFVNNFLNKIKLSKDGFKYLLLKDIFPQNAIDLNFIYCPCPSGPRTSIQIIHLLQSIYYAFQNTYMTFEILA